jgi:hypothetical protein
LLIHHAAMALNAFAIYICSGPECGFLKHV